SLLISVHAMTIGAVVFVLLGIEQIAATALIVFYGRLYRGRVCPTHLSRARYEGALHPFGEHADRKSARQHFAGWDLPSSRRLGGRRGKREKRCAGSRSARR
ncbi:MAG: hypothetical protein LC792_28915, partial [Actinobacteria bacterium]|nr:hypothetical protein [Actinomycetota bacterium]